MDGYKTLAENQEVEYEVEDTDKGPSAVNLQKTINEVSRSHLKVVK